MSRKKDSWFSKKNLDKTVIYISINNDMYLINNNLTDIKYEICFGIENDIIKGAILEMKDSFFYVYKNTNPNDVIILNMIFDYIYIHKKDTYKKLKNLLMQVLTKDLI